MISKQRLIDSLNEVKQQAIFGIIKYPDHGVCKNWYYLLGDDVSYSLVSKLSHGWEYRRDSDAFPVPYNEDFYLWEGVNLEMRLSLIDYILKQLEESSQECIDELYQYL